MVNHPQHYKEGGIESIDIIKAKLTAEAFEGFLHGNAMKYLNRANFKGRKLEDLRKARWYLNRMIREVDGEPEQEVAGG